MISRAWRWVRVPVGSELRLLAVAICMAVGLPRLPLVQDVLSFAPHRFGDADAWALLFVALGLALWATCYRGRLSLAGRVVAGVGAVSFVALAAATVSATSFVVDLSLATALAWEAGTNGR